MSKVKVKFHQNLITSRRHRNTYSNQVTSVSDQHFFRYCADTHTHNHTQIDRIQNNTLLYHIVPVEGAQSTLRNKRINVVDSWELKTTTELHTDCWAAISTANASSWLWSTACTNQKYDLTADLNQTKNYYNTSDDQGSYYSVKQCTSRMTSEAKYLDVSAEYLDFTIHQNPVLGLCNLSAENKPRTTNDLRRKQEETTVLCINPMFSDVTEYNDVTDVKLVNWIYWISGTSCNVS